MTKRWALLEHRVSRNILQGKHFDLLLEEVSNCRTWRLERIPNIDGPDVPITPHLPHKLYWLDIEESLVSGGRGWAQRIEGGFFLGLLPSLEQSTISIELVSQTISGIFQLNKNSCRLISLEKFNFI